jgi:hypothetical protein
MLAERERGCRIATCDSFKFEFLTIAISLIFRLSFDDLEHALCALYKVFHEIASPLSIIRVGVSIKHELHGKAGGVEEPTVKVEGPARWTKVMVRKWLPVALGSVRVCGTGVSRVAVYEFVDGRLDRGPESGTDLVAGDIGIPSRRLAKLPPSPPPTTL